MGGALKSELLKVTTTKLWLVISICIFVIAIGLSLLMGVALLFGVPEEMRSEVLGDPQGAAVLWTAGNSTVRILALVMGIMAMGTEYRHKLLPDTYLGTPKRWKVISAKALVQVGMGLLYGLLTSLGGLLVSVGVGVYLDADVPLADGETWKILLLNAVTIMLWTLLGMSLGILVKNMIVAIVIGVAFAYIIEPIIAFAFMILEWNFWQNLTPSAATTVFMGVENPLLLAPVEPFAWWGALLVMLAWCVLPGALGALVTVRRDV